MFTVEELTEECNNIIKGAGVSLPGLQIKINGRLKKTLGRCKYNSLCGKPIPYCIEFSRELLETATPHSVMEVVRHECAHAIVTARTGERHGHDKVFKAVCSEIGTTNDGTHYDDIERTVNMDQIYKYIIICRDCGCVAGRYHRAGKVIKNIQDYRCKCGGVLLVKQNY